MLRLTRVSFVFALVFLLVCLGGCGNYAGRIRASRAAFERGDYDAASSGLVKLVKQADNDQLLYLMDLGLVYHTAGQYEKAIETFLKADTLAEIKDYTSLSADAASLLINNQVQFYRGEDFEKILINMYLAIDYTMLGKWEDALVECRKVNHKLDMMISKGKLPYERNAFAKYLAAVLFEAQREYNDAFVDYRNLLKWKGEMPYLDIGLLRMADKLHAEQELRSYKKRFKKTKKYRLGRKEGEVILLLEQGYAPVKVPHPNFRLLPKFRKRTYQPVQVYLRVGKRKAQTQVYFNIEETAIRELDHRVGGIITKKLVGTAIKTAAAYGVAKATKSKEAGILAAWVLYAMDRADLRSWTTLPGNLQLARLTVPAGRHDIFLDKVTSHDPALKTTKVWKGVEVKPGQRVFLNYRLRN